MVIGVGDQCKNGGISWFTQFLSNHSSQEGVCMWVLFSLLFIGRDVTLPTFLEIIIFSKNSEIGDGALDSWFMSMTKQVSAAAFQVDKLQLPLSSFPVLFV